MSESKFIEKSLDLSDKETINPGSFIEKGTDDLPRGIQDFCPLLWFELYAYRLSLNLSGLSCSDFYVFLYYPLAPVDAI